MGKKYIIEKDDNESIWSIYADANGDATIEGVSLTPYTEHDIEQVRKEAYEAGMNSNAVRMADDKAHEAYQKGLNDAWECARTIFCTSTGELARIFDLEEDDNGLLWVYHEYTASEAIEKLKAYEQEQDGEIKVGDEVINQNKTAVVTEITDRYTRIMYSDGSGYALFAKGLTKTGRHFPEIAAVLEKMREESNG